jgi:hypothetical protein
VDVLTPAWDAPGLCLGFTSPISAFGEIGIRTRGDSMACFAGLVLDGVRLDPGESRALDALALSSGDWQASLHAWARSCAEAAGVRSVPPPPVGYCSWYQFGAAIESEHIRRALRELAAWPVPPGGRLVQIDDGFQVMPGDWGPNARFARDWDALPAAIASTGSVPGLWLAPHAVFHRHPLCAEHPDWLQRLPSGEPAVNFSNWGWCARGDLKWGDTSEPTYFLDPDHTGAQQFMHDVVSRAVHYGWRYRRSTSPMPYPRRVAPRTPSGRGWRRCARCTASSATLPGGTPW